LKYQVYLLNLVHNFKFISMSKITLLGTGLIGGFYTMSLLGQRRKDSIVNVCSARSARQFAEKWNIPRYTSSIKEAIEDPESDVVVIGLPNYLHREAVELACRAGKHILCTKPLAMNGKEAKEILDMAEEAGVVHGYLEDLVYTPKTLKTIAMIQQGVCGKVLWGPVARGSPRTPQCLVLGKTIFRGRRSCRPRLSLH
jgi:predicted dehydrogenase